MIKQSAYHLLANHGVKYHSLRASVSETTKSGEALTSWVVSTFAGPVSL